MVRRRRLSQHPGHDLIRQLLKSSMNLCFQIGELCRFAPQLGHPLPLPILQLLLHLPQHVVHVLHQGPTLTCDAHFHTPPAISGVLLVGRLHQAYSIPERF